MELVIRDPLEQDEIAWRKLWAEHADFHGVFFEPEAIAQTWQRILDPSSVVTMRIALIDGRLAGYAIFFPHPSTWFLSHDCYLEDLYTAEHCRGKGVGRALLNDLISIARRNDWGHVYWHTRRHNKAARALYDKFTKADDAVRYRLKL